MDEKKEPFQWHDPLKPLLESYLKRLFSRLEDEQVIIKVKSKLSDKYRLGDEKNELTDITTTTTIRPESNPVFHPLFDLRNIAKAVYGNLDISEAKNVHQLPFSKLIEKLEEDNAFSIQWKDKAEIFKIFDSLDALLNDPEIDKDIENKLQENDFNPNVVITSLLEFYGRQKIIQHFSDKDPFMIQKLNSENLDFFSFYHPEGGVLHFIFKFRRANAVPDNQLLLQAINHLRNQSQLSFVLLIIFTQENPSIFEKLQFQFRQTILNDLREYEEYTSKIKFIPISTGNMNQIDSEFSEFKRTYIQDHFPFEFKNQPPPRGFPERNDHFLERTFEVKKTNFNIIITPEKTDFWRFGLRYIQNDTFPTLAQGRHENPDVGDIHICVGNAEKIGDNLRWKDPYALTIENYHVEIVKEEFSASLTYSQGPVTLTVTSNNDASIVEFAVKTDDNILGKRLYDLRKFKYCRLSAWCDRGVFELKTDIKVTHSRQ
jgi:hypothetical protein